MIKIINPLNKYTLYPKQFTATQISFPIFTLSMNFPLNYPNIQDYL